MRMIHLDEKKPGTTQSGFEEEYQKAVATTAKKGKC